MKNIYPGLALLILLEPQLRNYMVENQFSGHSQLLLDLAVTIISTRTTLLSGLFLLFVGLYLIGPHKCTVCPVYYWLVDTAYSLLIGSFSCT